MKLAIIPARSGSKRIKNKNTMDFCGNPMIAYALSAAIKSKIFAKIHVSTESKQTKNIVESLGVKVDFLRSENLADDTTSLMSVMKWVLQQYQDRDEEYEDVCCLMPIAPLVEAEDIIRAFDKYLQNGRKNPLLMVSSFPAPLKWAYTRNSLGELIPLTPGGYAIRSQDHDKAYYESGPFTIFNREHIFSDDPPGDEGFISCVMPLERSIDIDEPEDLIIAETIYMGKLAQKNNGVCQILVSNNSLFSTHS